MNEATAAVALAPGVWTPLTEGATMQDAIDNGGLYGWTASVAAYEREYLNGEGRGGATW